MNTCTYSSKKIYSGTHDMGTIINLFSIWLNHRTNSHKTNSQAFPGSIQACFLSDFKILTILPLQLQKTTQFEPPAKSNFWNTNKRPMAAWPSLAALASACAKKQGGWRRKERRRRSALLRLPSMRADAKEEMISFVCTSSEILSSSIFLLYSHCCSRSAINIWTRSYHNNI